MSGIISKKFIVSITISAVAVIATGSAFAWFALRVYGADDELRVFDLDLVTLEEQRGVARSYQNIAETYRGELDGVRRFFVDSERPVLFIEDLERLAARTGNVIDLQLDPAGTTARELGFRLSLTGTESGVRGYLELLELLPYAIRISNVDFIKAADAAVRTPRGTRLTVTLSVSARN